MEYLRCLPVDLERERGGEREIETERGGGVQIDRYIIERNREMER